MNVFYVPNAEIEETVKMEGQEWRHCNKSLRHRLGDSITVVNGRGGKFLAKIVEASPSFGSIEVIEEVSAHNILTVNVHVAVSPTKQPARIEWAIEKMTEMGLSEITFLETQYSERVKIKMERIEKICVSAMKQSLQAHIPILNPITTLKAFFDKNHNIKGEKYIAYVEESESIFAQNYLGQSDVIVLIGPEGGFSEKEVKMAKDYGYKPVSLGPNRLRTETACIAACQTVHTINMQGTVGD